ncbi:MAG: SprT-like domain-containing protein [Bacteroidaceae bacterium]|nr:SprT-like domain-containing protein [Bacteroidaceae bacterium]
MTPTIPYIEKKFGEFNQLIFAGKLPKIPIVLSDAKTFLGKCVWKKRRGNDGKVEYYDFRLRINTRLDLPETEWEDILIHEMIHYYIGLNRLEDASSHGPLFTHLMKTINERYGRNITVSFKGTAEQREQLIDQKQRYHVVALMKLQNGKTGIKVLPRVLPSILKFYNAATVSKEVQSVKLYMTNDIFFNRFPSSAALKVHFVDEAEVLSHLEGAEVQFCDGKSIKRTELSI